MLQNTGLPTATNPRARPVAIKTARAHNTRPYCISRGQALGPDLAVTVPWGGILRTCDARRREERSRCRRLRASWFDNLKGASSGSETPEDDDGEGTMVPIDTESKRGITGEEAFGPLAVLLIGFLPEDYAAFCSLMEDMEADMVKVVPCTKVMMSGTLQEALEVQEPPSYEQPALGQRRALVLSGMYGAEVIEVVSAYKEAGLPPAVFAAAVPNNYQRVISGLVEEVYADHNAMKQQAAQRRAAMEAQGQE